MKSVALLYPKIFFQDPLNNIMSSSWDVWFIFVPNKLLYISLLLWVDHLNSKRGIKKWKTLPWENLISILISKKFAIPLGILKSLNASVAPVQKPVNWFAVQIIWLVSIWGQHWHLMG